VTDHSVERLAKLGQTERVRPSAGEHKINVAVDFENFPDASAHLGGPFIFTVSGRVMGIRPLQSRPRFGANRRRVITCKIVTSGVGAHRLYYVSFALWQSTQRDCLTAEPWASESARQIPPLLAPRIAYSSFISISEWARRMSVSPSKFLHVMIAFCCILPNARARTNLRQ
jgi:hypothetical protein